MAINATPSIERMFLNHRGHGPAHWINDRLLAVFDAQTAQQLDAENFADLTMLDGFTDTVLGQTSQTVNWNQLRGVWADQMRSLAGAENLQLLTERMAGVLTREGKSKQDLTWLIERTITASLIPTIINGLRPGSYRRIEREIHSKIAFVFSDTEPRFNARWNNLRMTFLQVIAGATVRRELLGRLKGRRPRQQDLADPVIDMIQELGIGRAVDAVTTLLTAITGSPGAVAACLAFEIAQRPDWRDRMQLEFGSVPPECLYQSPSRAAPTAARFVKETLRIWNSPSILLRRVRVPIRYGNLSLDPGQTYAVSPYLIHNDPDRWSNPDVFDPDRWLPDQRQEKCPHGTYAPFGWAPKSCIGATLGFAQLVMLAYLLCTRFRIHSASGNDASIIVASVVRPINFTGSIVEA